MKVMNTLESNIQEETWLKIIGNFYCKGNQEKVNFY